MQTMRRWSILLASLALGVGSTACLAMSEGVRGVVVTRRDCADRGATVGGPVAEAEVVVACPGRPPVTMATDADGRAFYALAEQLPLGCTIVASKPGYGEVRARIEDACAILRGGATGCVAASFYAELPPAASAQALANGPGVAR